MDGTVQMKGYLSLEAGEERILGASTLKFNFASPTKGITGNANQFELFRYSDRRAIKDATTACTASTCVYTALGEVTGEIDIKGNVIEITGSRPLISLRLNGTLENQVGLTSKTSRKIENVPMTGLISTNPDNSELTAIASSIVVHGDGSKGKPTQSVPFIPTTITDNGIARDPFNVPTSITGQWRRE